MAEKNVLTLPGRYADIRRLCQFVAAGAMAAGLSKQDIFHVELACDEACTNIIEHAYGGEDKGDITISWQIANEKFIVTIRDNGRAFEPEEIPTPPLLEKDDIENLKVGGLGIHFMRQLMDKVFFSFDQGGNTLTMVKNLSGRTS